jgi:glycogen operon protein
VGEGGYQVGSFPPPWSEWNGRYRDAVRDWWRGQPATLGEFAVRFTGSSDLYASTGRRPSASINFVTAHDGFTLHDLVSYDEKHNEANAEGNHDGESHNRSWNCGVEGATDDGEVLELRARQRRNLLATLLLSQGVPMLLGGDELGRTQHGNNNGYCQDNEVSWYDWEDADLVLLEWTRWLLRFRKEHPTFRRVRWFEGEAAGGVTDVGWFSPDGSEMSAEDWVADFAKSLGVFLNGDATPSRDDRGRPVTDDSFCVLFNAHHEALDFQLPQRWGEHWSIVMDTAEPLPPGPDASQRLVKSGDPLEVSSRSLVLLRRLA